MRKLKNQRIKQLANNPEKLNFLLGQLNEREFAILWEKINEKLRLDPLRRRRC